jgi:hypothetical protein
MFRIVRSMCQCSTRRDARSRRDLDPRLPQLVMPTSASLLRASSHARDCGREHGVRAGDDALGAQVLGNLRKACHAHLTHDASNHAP